MGSDIEASGPRVLLRVDSVSGCLPSATQEGWTEDEQARFAGITEPARRDQFLVAHWRVRGLAALLFGGNPGDWAFSLLPGEPATLEDRVRGTVCYGSVSHTGDVVACAVSDDVVGVDVEAIAADRDLLALAKRCLAPEDVEAITGLEGAEQAKAFYRGWSIREALGKAAGTGLVPNTARRIHVARAEPAEATVTLWRSPDTVLALAHGTNPRLQASVAWGKAPQHFTWDMS